jgi:hypothetical protein
MAERQESVSALVSAQYFWASSFIYTLYECAAI